jgi:hypothetical protein
MKTQVIEMFSRPLAGVALCACLLAPMRAKANVILPTLPPGSEYELVFATSGEVTGGSSNISAYNAFATSQAASLAALLPGDVTWDAVVSTGTAAANEAVNNAPSSASIPIYNTLGIEVSTGNLYSGTLLAPINYTQTGGTPPTTQIWTGSSTSGAALNPLVGPSDPEYGLYNSSGASWIASANNLPAGIGWPIYALSSPITAVPEPGTMSLIAVALLCGAGVVLRRRRKSAACDAL